MDNKMDEKISNKLAKQMEKINSIFNTSNQEIDSMDIGLKENQIVVIKPEKYDLTDDQFKALELSEDGSVFELLELKSDFIMVKRNLKRLIHHGQTLFDQTASLDMEDLKASQITALSELSNSINRNLMDLVGLYKTIVDIETIRRGNPGPTAYGQNNLIQGNLQQQIFVGNAADALKQIKKKPEDD